jgi:hypothetical protein
VRASVCVSARHRAAASARQPRARRVAATLAAGGGGWRKQTSDGGIETAACARGISGIALYQTSLASAHRLSRIMCAAYQQRAATSVNMAAMAWHASKIGVIGIEGENEMA